MMSETINERLMAAHRTHAEGSPGVGGMMNVTPVKLLTHMKIYRFASAGKSDDDVYSSPWWFGVSAYEALEAWATHEKRTLRDEARLRLAVPPEWSNMDVLLCATIRQPLSAWSGTPRTARTKKGQRYGPAWTPDRSMTQLYIPLRPAKKNNSEPDKTSRDFEWSDVLRPVFRRNSSVAKF